MLPAVCACVKLPGNTGTTLWVQRGVFWVETMLTILVGINEETDYTHKKKSYSGRALVEIKCFC